MSASLNVQTVSPLKVAVYYLFGMGKEMETHSCPKGEDVETPLIMTILKQPTLPHKISGFHENYRKGKQYSSRDILYCC